MKTVDPFNNALIVTERWVQSAVVQGDIAAIWADTDFHLRLVWAHSLAGEDDLGPSTYKLAVDDAPHVPGWDAFADRIRPGIRNLLGWLDGAEAMEVEAETDHVVSVVWSERAPTSIDEDGYTLHRVLKFTMRGPAPWRVAGIDGSIAVGGWPPHLATIDSIELAHPPA